MGNVQIDVPVKKIELEAVIVRANGKVENLGTIAHWDKSLTRRTLFKMKKFTSFWK